MIRFDSIRGATGFDSTRPVYVPCVLAMCIVRQQRALATQLLAQAQRPLQLQETDSLPSLLEPCLSLELFAPDTRTRIRLQEARLDRRPALYLHSHRTELGSPTSAYSDSIPEEGADTVQLRREYSSLQRRANAQYSPNASPASKSHSLRRMSHRSSLYVDEKDAAATYEYSTFPRKLTAPVLSLSPPPIAEAEASAGRNQPLALPYASDRAHEWIASVFATVQLAQMRQHQREQQHKPPEEDGVAFRRRRLPSSAGLFLFPDSFPRCRVPPPASKSLEGIAAADAATLTSEKPAPSEAADTAAVRYTNLYVLTYCINHIMYKTTLQCLFDLSMLLLLIGYTKSTVTVARTCICE